MSKIGVIFCSYGTLDLTPASLAPWLAAKASRLDGHEFLVAAVSCPFSGFPDAKDDGTVESLRKCLDEGQIDHLETNSFPIPETEARGRVLHWLAGHGCELSIMVDSDEFWTADQISKALSFMESRPHLAWVRVCLKNYVFDTKTYLAEPFSPPRIHRLFYRGVHPHSAVGFEQDNDVWYEQRAGGPRVSQGQLPSATVPRSQVWVRHHSWLSNERSRKKIEYQLIGRKWPSCSFSWDDTKGGLIWNPDLPIPETETDP